MMLSSRWKNRLNSVYSLTAIICLLVLVFSTVYAVRAQTGSGNITSFIRSENETLGTFSINASEVVAGAGGYLTTVNATVDVQPEAGNVFEGWLVDSSGAIYALSLGTFRDGELHFSQYMTNPFVYDEFIMTQEPLRDSNPDITPPPLGSISLRDPFGE
jgi:hypothetical protein